MSKKSAAAVKVQTVQVLSPIKMEFVKRNLVEASLDELKIEHNPEMDLQCVVDLLQYHNRDFVAPTKLTECVQCDGVSNKDLPVCPYCGEGAEDEQPLVTTPDDAQSGGVVEGSAMAKTTTKKNNAALAIAPEFSTAALDEVTAEILELKKEAQNSWWKMGRAITKVYDGELWKARVVDGKAVPMYRSFGQYVSKELQISNPTAYSMMEVAKSFSEKQVAQIGGTKLGLVLKAPTADQDAMFEEAQKGTPVRELGQKVDAARKKAGVTKRDTGKKKMPQGKPAKPQKAREDGKVTVAMTEGSKTIALFKKPSKKGEPLETPAKQVGDEPVGMEELSNGVTRYYTLSRNNDGVLKLKIETRRAEAS